MTRKIFNQRKKLKVNSVALIRERTIPTERLPLVDEVNAEFADRGCRVISTTDPYDRILVFSRPKPLLLLRSSSSTVLTRLSGPHSRPTTSKKKSGSAGNRTLAPGSVARNH
jgi:hypothetical protein